MLLCIQYRNTHPLGFASGFVFLYCIQISGNWSTPPSPQLLRTADHEIFVIKTPFVSEFLELVHIESENTQVYEAPLPLANRSVENQKHALPNVYHIV